MLLNLRTDIKVNNILWFSFKLFIILFWSDERKWKSNGWNSYFSYWHDLRKEPKILLKIGFGDENVMVWAALWIWSRWTWVRQHSYEILKLSKRFQFKAAFYLNTADRQSRMFQHNNIKIHDNHSTKRLLAARNVAVMNLPSSSPNRNSIEKPLETSRKEDLCQWEPIHQSRRPQSYNSS